MARPVGVVVTLGIRWNDPEIPTAGMFIGTGSGRWYEVTAVRRVRTEKPKFILTCIVRGTAYTPPPDARLGYLVWDARGPGRRRRSRAPVL